MVDQIANAERAVTARAMAAREKRPIIRKRLLAVAMIWEGKKIRDVVLKTGIWYHRLKQWVARADEQGLQSLCCVRRGRNVERLKIVGAELRAMTAGEFDQGKVRRLLAVANVAEGMTVTEAAVQAGVTCARMTDWVRRCVEQGPEALRTGRAAVKIEERRLQRCLIVPRICTSLGSDLSSGRPRESVAP